MDAESATEKHEEIFSGRPQRLRRSRRGRLCLCTGIRIKRLDDPLLYFKMKKPFMTDSKSIYHKELYITMQF